MPIHLMFGLGQDISLTGCELTSTLMQREDTMLCDTPLEIIKGTSRTLKYVAENQNGELVDLAGSKMWFTVKNKAYLDVDDDTNIIFQLKNTAAGGSDTEILITTAVNLVYPKYEIYIVGTNTQTVPVDTYAYDIKVVFVDGTRGVLQRGDFVVSYRSTASFT